MEIGLPGASVKRHKNCMIRFQNRWDRSLESNHLLIASQHDIHGQNKSGEGVMSAHYYVFVANSVFLWHIVLDSKGFNTMRANAWTSSPIRELFLLSVRARACSCQDARLCCF
jgi:hypothetical protein